MKLYYMRDNHTFRSLPLDVEQAIAILQEEYAGGYSYGMLCAEPRRGSVCHGHKEFAEFAPRARAWISAELAYKSPADLEYESWAAAPAPSPGPREPTLAEADDGGLTEALWISPSGIEYRKQRGDWRRYSKRFPGHWDGSITLGTLEAEMLDALAHIGKRPAMSGAQASAGGQQG